MVHLICFYRMIIKTKIFENQSSVFLKKGLKPFYIMLFLTAPMIMICNCYSGFIIQNYTYLDNNNWLFFNVVLWASFERICMTSLYVSLTSFFASKVDESIGASYMALLWTITNMSGLICDTGAMWLTGKFEEFSGYIPNWDAYHYVLALLTIISIGWYACCTLPIVYLQRSKKEEWSINIQKQD